MSEIKPLSAEELEKRRAFALMGLTSSSYITQQLLATIDVRDREIAEKDDRWGKHLHLLSLAAEHAEQLTQERDAANLRAKFAEEDAAMTAQSMAATINDLVQRAERMEKALPCVTLRLAAEVDIATVAHILRPLTDARDGTKALAPEAEKSK